jgi:hypothetical protein
MDQDGNHCPMARNESARFPITDPPTPAASCFLVVGMKHLSEIIHDVSSWVYRLAPAITVMLADDAAMLAILFT